jgi:hypothetical protein
VPTPPLGDDDANSVSEPEVSEPEVTEPEVSEPEASEPDVSEPAPLPPEPVPVVEGDDDGEPTEPVDMPEPVPNTDAGMSESEVLECPFNEELSYDPGAAYPFCQWGELPSPFGMQPGQAPPAPLGWEKYCPQYEDSWGFYNWHAEGDTGELCENDDTCNACNCSIHCDQDTPSGCPAGETGNATPACFNVQAGAVGSGDCWLTCNEGEQCPDGMQCVFNPEYASMVCAWITEGDRCSDEQLYSSP